MNSEIFFFMLRFIVVAMSANAIHILIEKINEWLELKRKNKRF